MNALAQRRSSALSYAPALTPQQSVTDAFFHYRNEPREDLTRLRVDAVPDMSSNSFTARDVRPHVADTGIVSLSWQLRAPDGRLVHTMETASGDSDALTRPFRLEPSHFSGVYGLYRLSCNAIDAEGLIRLRTTRDFRMLAGDASGGTQTFGNFTFTKYEKKDAKTPSGNYSVTTNIQFLPNVRVNCSEVGWIQTVQSLSLEGEANYINAILRTRGTSVAWSIDRDAYARSPFYGAGTDAVTGKPIMPRGWGHFTSKDDPEAELRDVPTNRGARQRRYESCAICHSGGTPGEFYGCATWGYTADAQGRVTLHPRSITEAPSEEFVEARRMWNDWRETLPEAERPRAVPWLTPGVAK